MARPTRAAPDTAAAPAGPARRARSRTGPRNAPRIPALPMIRSLTITEGRAADVTRQPEQIRAFRDTWKWGVNSYLRAGLRRMCVASLFNNSASASWSFRLLEPRADRRVFQLPIAQRTAASGSIVHLVPAVISAKTPRCACGSRATKALRCACGKTLHDPSAART
jgi:hypothetical protein